MWKYDAEVNVNHFDELCVYYEFRYSCTCTCTSCACNVICYTRGRVGACNDWCVCHTDHLWWSQSLPNHFKQFQWCKWVMLNDFVHYKVEGRRSVCKWWALWLSGFGTHIIRNLWVMIRILNVLHAYMYMHVCIHVHVGSCSVCLSFVY